MTIKNLRGNEIGKTPAVLMKDVVLNVIKGRLSTKAEFKKHTMYKKCGKK